MLLPITIDKLSSVSFQEQISEQLRRLILDGLLSPGTRVPTSRELAREAGLSRNTVTLAYERLIGEGYLQTRPASGTFVAEILPALDHAPPAPRPNTRSSPVRPPIVFRGRPWRPPIIKPEFDLRLSAADPDLFPTREWRRHILSALDHHGGRISHSPPTAGEPKLRHAIARWLGASRGLAVKAEEVLVLSGRQQAYAIAAQLLLRPGVGVAVEMPCHGEAVLAFEAAGANLLPVAVDESGIRPDRLPADAALAYLTPSHQRPVGGILSLERRREILAWAGDTGCYLFEDDFGCEFHYDGWQPPPLKSLDQDGLVIYCGDFSLTLGGGLGLGYMLPPPELAAAALSVKAQLDNGCPWLEQAALANLMETGSFTRHLTSLKKLFQERRDHLVDALRRNFAAARIIGSEAGTHVGLLLPEGSPDAEAIQRNGLERGIAIHAAAPCCSGAVTPYQQRTLYLGYGALPGDRTQAAVDRLSEVIGRLG